MLKFQDGKRAMGQSLSRSSGEGKGQGWSSQKKMHGFFLQF